MFTHWHIHYVRTLYEICTLRMFRCDKESSLTLNEHGHSIGFSLAKLRVFAVLVFCYLVGFNVKYVWLSNISKFKRLFAKYVYKYFAPR